MAEMEDYVDKLGSIKPKHFKHKDLSDIGKIAMKELGTHTENLSEQQERMRQQQEEVSRWIG